ncbi:hypothetical protein JCGZ_06391 [Jatropha curcas]|uniref:Uncharacterized protein n=1 Tax=Jatropha curcas TaxID=180498 RepID=A0A067KNN4_JATCU|nr:hypothetical protein JCGZ_06391 [Jatropha curcas]
MANQRETILGEVKPLINTSPNGNAPSNQIGGSNNQPVAPPTCDQITRRSIPKVGVISNATATLSQTRYDMCEYSNFEAQKACFPRLQTVRLDRRPFEKFTESMPIWYLKPPENYKDRGTGPGIFFGGTELPKKPWTEKLASGQDRVTAAAVHGGSSRRPLRRRHQPGFPY